MIGLLRIEDSEDRKVRIIHARQRSELRRGGIGVRTPIAQTFRRMMQTAVEPAFREVAELAAQQGIVCLLECDVGGVRPRAMFCIRPSGRSIRYEMDADGGAVREIEGVYLRPMRQRMAWTDAADLQRQLTSGYARAAAARIVQDHFRTSKLITEGGG